MSVLQEVIAAVLDNTESKGRLRGRGISPVRQARSKATFGALIESGLQLVERKDFSTITIEEVAGAAKVSVGAFYERFSSKETFCAALQEIVATKIERDVRSRIAGAGFSRLGYEDAVRAIIEAWLAGVRVHRGLIRASLRHLPVRADAWFPLKKLGSHMADIYVEALSSRIPPEQKTGLKGRVRVALQFVHGVVVNTILNSPGPLALDDRELDRRIYQVMMLFIVEGTDPGKTRTRQKEDKLVAL